MAEGVGFEPTVSFPTLDFESSALNRTQPPFLEERRKRRTRLRQKLRRGKRRTPINREQTSKHPTSNATGLEIRRSALCSAHRLACPDASGKQDFSPHEAKNVTIKRLPRVASLLHLVCPHGQPRYYLLLTDIHRFLAPLFTSIANLFGTSTLLRP